MKKRTFNYRQFETAKECWNEMLKHQPFGWVKCPRDGNYMAIILVDDEGECVWTLASSERWPFEKAIDALTFADGAPFGVRED